MVKKKESEQEQDNIIKNIEDIILREYDVRSIKKLKGGPKVWKVVTDRGNRFFKMTKYSPEELDFVRQVLEHVNNQGFRKVARFIVTKFGDHFVQEKDKLFYMTDWIEGKECNLGKLPHLEEAVFTLAELHQASRNFEFRSRETAQERSKLVRLEWGIWQKLFEERAREIQEIARSTDSSRGSRQLNNMLTSKASSIYAWAVQASNLLEQGSFQSLVERASLQKTISHRSYTGSNVILGKNGRGAFVVDLDHCVYDVQIHDLARMMGRILPKYQWDITIAKQIIDWYSYIRPLDELEKNAIIAYLAFPHKLYQFYKLPDREQSVEEEAKSVVKLQEELLKDELRKEFLRRLISELKLDLNLDV